MIRSPLFADLERSPVAENPRSAGNIPIRREYVILQPAPGPPEPLSDRMSRRGFTLVELLTAIVLMAILAAISLKIVNARAQAYLAVMESDLKNLALAQEIYYEESAGKPGGASYASNLNQLDVSASPNVQLQMVGQKEGWTARAQHKLRTDFRCAVYVGDIKAMIQPYEPAITEGVIECEPKAKGKGKGK